MNYRKRIFPALVCLLLFLGVLTIAGEWGYFGLGGRGTPSQEARSQGDGDGIQKGEFKNSVAKSEDGKVGPSSGRRNSERESSRSILPSEGSIAEKLDDLRSRARSGDNDAAIQLYVDLSTCANILRRAEEFHQTRGENVPESVRDVARLQIERLLDSCKGVSATDTQKYIDWLTMAAERGNAWAQIMWVEAYSSSQDDPAWSLKNPEKVIDYKSRARSYLNSLAKECNLNAIAILKWQHEHSGVFVDIDQNRAYMYALVLQTMNGDPAIDKAVSRIEGRINAGDVAKGRMQADAFVSSYCK